jgi:diguanylate cyclase
MIFGKRKKNPESEPEAEDASSVVDVDAGSASDAPAIPAEIALDFIAEMLRTLGENAFSVGPRTVAEIEAFFEGWARHLLVGVRPPRDGVDESGEKAPARDEERSSRRDLPGLRRAFREHRKQEVSYVTTSLNDFREASWAFIGGLRRSLTVEQTSDRRLGHRMRRLEGAVRSGEPDRIKSEAQETVSLLTEFLADRGARHQAQIADMAKRLENLRDELDNVRAQAAIDSLTQVYNRASFDEQIEREVDLATLFGKRGCLLMIDIDHFKWVNDTHGHPCGDAVLRSVAESLSRCYQRKDDFVARYGGEEFAIVLRDITLPVARNVAERGMDAIRRLEIEHPGVEEPIRITASIGIARLRKGEMASSWIERADRALYQAKNAGRDCIEVDPIDLEEA